MHGKYIGYLLPILALAVFMWVGPISQANADQCCEVHCTHPAGTVGPNTCSCLGGGVCQYYQVAFDNCAVYACVECPQLRQNVLQQYDLPCGYSEGDTSYWEDSVICTFGCACAVQGEWLGSSGTANVACDGSNCC